MSDGLREQVAKALSPYWWSTPGFDNMPHIQEHREEARAGADAVIAVATPIIRRQVIEELIAEIDRERADGYTVNVRFYLNPHEDREVRLADWLRPHLDTTEDTQ